MPDFQTVKTGSGRVSVEPLSDSEYHDFLVALAEKLEEEE
jgi:hypothetical protein